MDIAKLCEDSWDTSLEVTADCVEVFARARDTGGDCEPACKPCPPGGGRDFLYDVVNLNVGYWMQLARLGSAYSIYAHRAVGALYGLYSAPRSRPAPCESLVFTGVETNTQTKRLLLCNPTPTAARPKFTLSPLMVDGKKVNLKECFKRNGKDAESLDILPDDRVRVDVTVTIPSLPLGRYSTTLQVDLDSKHKQFPVTLCVR